MKRLLLILFALAALAARAAAPMQYRILPVGSSEWMNPKLTDEVHRQIDRIAADGYNVISIGTFTFLPMHIVDYSASPYPEAAEYSAEKVRQNLATLRENIRYAKKRGVRYVVTRSYSHYAPYKFWKAHQAELNPDGVFDDLLMRAHQNDMYQKALAGNAPNCVPQQQWTNPCFREFFLWSTARALDLLPEIDGFLNAYAEAAWTYDVAKLRPATWRSWKECVDYEKTDSCFVDYSNRLARMLRDKRGDGYFFGMRDWYVKPEVMMRLDIPREKLVLSVKYAGYDQPLVNYPPWAKSMLDDGYGVVLDIHVYDAEYPHPVYWYDNNVINTIFANMGAGGFTGLVYEDYTLRGEDTADNPVRRLTQLSVAGAMNGKPWTDADALTFLQKPYGKGALHVLASLKAAGHAQQQFIKLMPAWFWRGDGLSVGGIQPLQFWQMFDNPEAPEGMAFVRQDAVGGLKGHPVENVTIEDCDLLLFGSVNEPQMIYRDVPENEKKYPEFDCYGTCPAYGLYFRHVDGLNVKNVRLRLANNDVRPAVVMDDVKNYTVRNIDYEVNSRTEPYPMWHQQDGQITDKK